MAILMRFGRTVIPALVALAAGGCQYPQDPGRSLEKISNGQMRVGVSASAPWAWVENGRGRGLEAELVSGLARELGATVQWVEGPESKLLESLENRELDLVIGGLTRDTPYESRIGLTYPYLRTQSIEAGKPREREHVLAVAPGENAWLVKVERFLRAKEKAGELSRLHDQEVGGIEIEST